MDYQKIVSKQIELIKQIFFNDKNQLMYKQNKTIASLWDYSAYFTAVIKLYKIDRLNNEKLLLQTVTDLEWYLSTDRTDGHLVYASEKGTEKPVFYDDNVWLAIGFIELYEITENKEYLKKAMRILDFIYASWQEDLGGGLLWREFPANLDKEKWVRNTCINAPSSYASLRIYELTKNNYYLDWGTKIYEWTKITLKDPNSYLYFDNINHYQVIEPTYWTYNVGVMISTAALLYGITKKQEYENDAINGVVDAYSKLAVKHENNQTDFHYYDDHPWFRVYLFQGYLDAYKHLKNNYEVKERFDEILRGFDYMYENYQEKEKLILNSWSKNKENNKEDEALFAAGNLESLCLFEEYQRLKIRDKGSV